MTGISKTLKDINISDDVLIGLSGTAGEVTVEQTLLSGDNTIETAKINGTAIYAPKQPKTDGQFSGNNYALKVDNAGYAYVNVPWTDKFCTSAWYDSQTKQICLSVGPDVLSVDVADLVKTYEADETTTELNGNKFSVKSGIYADSIAAESKHMNLDDYTLGGYLSALTQNLGGTCTDN